MGGPGFCSGALNPSCLRGAFLVKRKEARKARAKARVVEARAASGFRGVHLSAAGLRSPLSARERAGVVELVTNGGLTQLEAGAAFGVSQAAVGRALKKARAAAQPSVAGGDDLDLLAAAACDSKTPRTGRPSSLSPAAEAALREAVLFDPFGTVGEYWAHLENCGINVSFRTVYNWLEHLSIGKRAVENYAPLSAALIHGILNHIEAINAALESGLLGWENLLYADQTPVYMNVGHSSGYGGTVVFGDSGDSKDGIKVGNLWCVFSARKVLRVWMTDVNGDEESAKEFFLSDALPAGWINLYGESGNIFDLIAQYGRSLGGRQRKCVLCLDRLGKSGSSVYAVAGHHAPELRVRARAAGVGLLMLPPKGAYVNPIENWNGWVKRFLSQWRPPGGAVDNWGQLVRGPRTKEEAIQALKEAAAASDANISALRAFYHCRCAGQDLLRRLDGHSVAKAVFAERAAAPVKPFDVLETAFAPRARMSTLHAYPRSRTVADTYNVYYYRHERLGLHVGLPAPFKRPIDRSDGFERSCRLCSKHSKAAKVRDSECLCCSTCPGVFHLECVHLPAVPAGAWKCASCELPEKVVPRVYKQPKPEGAAKAPSRKRRRAPEGEEEAGSG